METPYLDRAIDQLNKCLEFANFNKDSPEIKKQLAEYKAIKDALNSNTVSDRFQVTQKKLADWGTVSIGDTKTKKIVCHFNTENGFHEAVNMAKKISDFLNGC